MSPRRFSLHIALDYVNRSYDFDVIDLSSNPPLCPSPSNAFASVPSCVVPPSYLLPSYVTLNQTLPPRRATYPTKHPVCWTALLCGNLFKILGLGRLG